MAYKPTYELPFLPLREEVETKKVLLAFISAQGYLAELLPLYRQRSGFAPQYFVLGLQTTSSRVYTRVKRFGLCQTFPEAV